MRSEKRDTHLTRSRRAQLVAAGIEVLAARGYAHTSLADVAEHAGTSKGVLLYHFAGKDELISRVVEEVFDTAVAVCAPPVREAPEPRTALATYLRVRVGFLKTHRAHMQALLEIWINHRGPDGRQRLDADRTLVAIEDLLRAGQSGTAFRAFPTRPMAVVISQAVDGALLQLLEHPDLDLDQYAEELVTLFDLATRRGP